MNIHSNPIFGIRCGKKKYLVLFLRKRQFTLVVNNNVMKRIYLMIVNQLTRGQLINYRSEKEYILRFDLHKPLNVE